MKIAGAGAGAGTVLDPKVKVAVAGAGAGTVLAPEVKVTGAGAAAGTVLALAPNAKVGLVVGSFCAGLLSTRFTFAKGFAAACGKSTLLMGGGRLNFLIFLSLRVDFSAGSHAPFSFSSWSSFPWASL